MTLKHRYYAVTVFAAMALLSLACTLGGDSASVQTDTPVARISETPSVTAPTVASSTPAPVASDTPVASPTDTPTPTATPIVGSGPGGCVLKGTYVADVTIPDGTVLAPNASFVKTWRIRNDGTCSWDAGYQLVYASGNQMSGPGAVGIPAAAPGQTVDISVNLAAPANVGDYAGTWRLRASNNAIFGGYTVVIKVAGTPTPTPTPTATPTLTGGGIWGGAWETTYGVMNLVQSGNSVTGFYNNGAGRIDGTVSGNLLSGTYTEGGTTGSVDFWIEGTGQRWHGNWDKTNAWCGHRSGQTDLTPCAVSTWYGTWATKFDSGVPCGDMTLTQSGDSVNGKCSGGGSIVGTVDGSKLTGTMTRNPGSPTQVTLAFKFIMLSNGSQFQGNFSGTSFWCGYRGSGSFPDPCFTP